MENIIISLTSYPDRIDTVYLVIESLLRQTILPEKIILWLANEQFPNKENDLPKKLLNLRNDIFEIDWCEDIRSYKKLIPALKKYPDKTIVTCDDDVIYKENCIKELYKSHLTDKESIWCHRGHYITMKNKQVKKYSDWIKRIHFRNASFNILQTGVGAVLYPKNCFYKDILNENLFMNIAFDTDDIWFWAMAVLNNTKIGIVKHNLTDLVSIIKDDKNTLYEINKTGRNDENLSKIIKNYPQLLDRLSDKLPVIYSTPYKNKRKYSIFGLKITM